MDEHILSCFSFACILQPGIHPVWNGQLWWTGQRSRIRRHCLAPQPRVRNIHVHFLYTCMNACFLLRRVRATHVCNLRNILIYISWTHMRTNHVRMCSMCENSFFLFVENPFADQCIHVTMHKACARTQFYSHSYWFACIHMCTNPCTKPIFDAGLTCIPWTWPCTWCVIAYIHDALSVYTVSSHETRKSVDA